MDSLRFVKLPSAEEPDPLATARSRRGEGSNTYRQHEQLTAREREPLRSVEAYEKEAAENAGGEEIRTPRGTRIRSGSVKVPLTPPPLRSPPAALGGIFMPLTPVHHPH